MSGTDVEVAFADVAAGVRAAIAAHAQAQDDGRTDDLVELYCSDGAVDVPQIGLIEGHAALREAFGGWGPTVPQRHMVSNILITAWNEREATSISDVVFSQKGEGGWAVQVVARYHDQFRNEAGTWRLSRRSMQFVT